MDAGAPPYLSDQFLRGLNLSYEEALVALRAAFRRRAESRDPVAAKLRLNPGDGRFFQAMPAVLDDIAVVKWIVSTPASATAGKYIHAQLIASHAYEGQTLAIMDFAFGTGFRTAAVSAMAADYWSNPQASTIAMIGCGLQARTHLDALLAVRPVKKIIAVSRTKASAQRYADEVKQRELEAVVLGPDDDAIYEADIIVSMVPVTMDAPPFLDGRCVRPGTLAIGVDIARAWMPDSLSAFDHVTTDDASQSQGLVASGMVKIDRGFDSDLAAAAAGRCPVRWSADKKIFCIPPGLALADAAIVRTILRKTGILE